MAFRGKIVKNSEKIPEKENGGGGGDGDYGIIYCEFFIFHSPPPKFSKIIRGCFSAKYTFNILKYFLFVNVREFNYWIFMRYFTPGFSMDGDNDESRDRRMMDESLLGSEDLVTSEGTKIKISEKVPV